MVPKGLITQIALIGLSVGIFFTYLQPSFSAVRESQDKLALYKSEREKVKGVNEKLNSLVKDAATINAKDRTLLDQYLPAAIDDVAVQRDLLAILDSMGIVPTALSAAGKQAGTAAEGEGADANIANAAQLSTHQFGTSVSVRYEEMLQLLRLFEVNAYPLDVMSVKIGAVSGVSDDEAEQGAIPGALSVDLEIVTYALTHGITKTE